MSLFGDASVALARLGTPLMAAMLVMSSGLAVGLWATRRRELCIADALAAAPGVGVLTLALVWWLFALAGVPLGPAVLAALALGGAGAAVALVAASRPGRGELAELGWLIGVWVATLVVRLATVRDLALPAWVDGVHHTYLTELLIRGRGLPADYGPLLPFGPFSYHFGFHALAASAAMLSGAAAPDAVLAAGQLLSSAAAPAAYLLARLYGAPARAGLVAAAVAGLVSVMPAYYVSWSRFTELAGLVAVPVLLLLARACGRDRSGAVAAGLAGAAMLVVHPRVLVLALVLLLADVVLVRREWRLDAGRLTAAGVVAAAVALPWLARLVGGLVPRLGVAPAGLEVANRLDLTSLSTARDPWIYGLAAAVAVGGALTGSAGARVALVWLALVAVAANPDFFGLPGSYMISNGAVVIALWLPASALVGAGLVSAIDVLSERIPERQHWVEAAIAPAALLAGLALSSGARDTLNSGTVLATVADRRALAAAAAILPPDAIVAVNVREWQLQTYMGSDAGYWVGVLTPGRAIVPPLLYGLGPPDWARGISEGLSAYERAESNPRALVELMRRTGAGWLFVGELGGAIDPAALAALPELEPVLVEGAPRLYRLRPS